MDCHQPKVLEKPSGKSGMLFCDGCDKGYHMDCHQPKVLEKPSGMSSMLFCDVTRVTTWTVISRKSWKSRLVSRACCSVM